MYRRGLTILLTLSILFFGGSFYVAAQSEQIDDLKEKIGDRTSKIRALEKEIERYETELEDVGEEKQTLQSAIRTLDLSQGKLQTEMNITQNRISATTFEISKLVLDISDKERRIHLHTDTLAQSIRTINAIDETSFVETILAANSISDYWEQVEDIQQFQTTLRSSLDELKLLKEGLIDDKSSREQKRRELLNDNQELEEQEQAIEINKREKNSLLTQTENKESNYISLLEEKKQARAEFERELLDFESQLRIAIDPNSIPNPRKGILSYPVDAKPFVTQYFGDTEFARNNSAVYNGSGHNGIDLRASVGTRIKSALSGTVTGTGNTDAIPGCWSYGKWILIKHNNGLSTLYAHLSDIAVSAGESVLTGQTIGYSGNTGYSTGPHLHMGLFATQGVQLVRFGDYRERTNCADAILPVAPLEAYLDPNAYLDSI